ncbi:hypothetical protein BY458DRAFT_591557 [Sporodiniella umbellata]|nr:hypothetical protein BY458DRAFT_591557 [Sporodiniella umbellata]
MSRLFKALEEYIEKKKSRATIVGFMNDDIDKNKDLITDWLAPYVDYEDAKKDFRRAFIAAYQRRFPHSKTKKHFDFDISVEFAASEAAKNVTKDGINALTASSNQAYRRLKNKMVCDNPSLAESSPSSPLPTPTTIYRLKNNVEIVEPLLHDTHQLLASKNIILLKEKEYDPVLLNYISIDDIELLRDTVSQVYTSEEKLNDNIHTRLSEITRGVNKDTKRSCLKKELAELYTTASEDDEKVLDVYLNCLNKLPNFRKTEEISEMELITNYLDPVLSPIFHNPEKNKHLLWLNRKEENTNSLRPDAVIKHYDMKLSGTTLGYCEVKPADVRHDTDSLCTGLVRLALFSRKIVLRKENNIACTLQAVVSSICNDITIMNEVISLDVPMQIKELANINTIVDELKQMSKIYENHCLKRYASGIEDDDTNIALILKPKRRKYATDTTPITFN